MAIKRPDTYEHNNPNLPIADSDFVRGGSRSAVQTLNDLYALTGKAGQLKQHSTQIYVSGENKIYLLKDLNNIGNSNGWEEFNFGGNVNLNTINGNTSFGIYKYKIGGGDVDSYLRQQAGINISPIISGIRNEDIVNLYIGVADNGVLASNRSITYKVNPGILVNHNNEPSSRNLIKFNNNSMYSGKAIRKVRYNSTIGNGYERFQVTPGANDLSSAPIVRPKTRRLETFYDINVPSGGGTRFIVFRTPTSFPFVQGTCMNLRFSFKADNSPCVISGLAYGTNGPIFTITGANYDFVQKERVILISKGGSGATAEFKLW
jgi:hypothetical protein